MDRFGSNFLRRTDPISKSNHCQWLGLVRAIGTSAQTPLQNIVFPTVKRTHQHSVLDFFRSVYQGALPVVVAAFVAAMAVAISWPHLSGSQTYHDVVVGLLAWDDEYKARDYLAVSLFLGLTLTLSLVFAVLRCRTATSKHKLREPDFLVLMSALPALWRLSVAGTTGGPEAAGRGQIVVSLLAVIFGFAAFLLGKEGVDLRFPGNAAKMAFKGGILSFFAALGLIAATTRNVVAFELAPKVTLWLTLMAAVLGALMMYRFASKDRRDSPRNSKKVAVFVSLITIPVAMLFFALVPSRIEVPTEILAPRFPLMLPTLICVAVLISAWQAVRIYRSSIPLKDPLTSAVGLSAIAVFVVMPRLRAPHLVDPVNFLHFGEESLPWQQLTEFGKTPYVDFIPIHGLMGFARGLLNATFFDSTAASHPAANSLLLAISIGALFFATRQLVGSTMATVIAAMGFTFSDRFYFLAPALFVLAAPNILSKPGRWLSLWVLICPFMIFYNAPIGLAYSFGTLGGAVVMTYRAYRSGPRSFRPVLVTAFIVAVVFFAYNQEVLGFIRFVLENQADNDVANGISWIQSFRETQRFPNALHHFVFELGRTAWIWVLLATMTFSWRSLSRPSERRNASLHWLGFLAIPTFMLTLPWALARIDPGVMSRTGALSAVAVVQLLPVLLLLRYRRETNNLRRLVPVAVAVGVVDFHNVYPAALAEKAATVNTVNGGISWFDGRAHGLSNIGTVADDSSVHEAVRFHRAAGAVLRKGETFFNLTYASSFYYFEGLPVPTLYAEYLAPASGAAQARMLHQMSRNPPVAVLAGPFQARDAPAQLRTYYLYREFAKRYVPATIDGFSFLLRPDRARELGVSSQSRDANIERFFHLTDWKRIPSAWGRSWPTLEARFDIVDTVHASERISDSIVRFNLKDRHLRGSQADFLRLDMTLDNIRLAGRSADSVDVRWMTKNRWFGPVHFIAGNPILLLPMGSQPSWLLSDDLQQVEFRVTKPAHSRIAPISKITILHLRDVH